MPTVKQVEVAEKVGISASFYCDILHERRTPRPDVAERLETVTGVKFKAWLMPEKHYNKLIDSKMKKDYSYNKDHEDKTIPS